MAMVTHDFDGLLAGLSFTHPGWLFCRLFDIRDYIETVKACHKDTGQVLGPFRVDDIQGLRGAIRLYESTLGGEE